MAPKFLLLKNLQVVGERGIFVADKSKPLFTFSVDGMGGQLSKTGHMVGVVSLRKLVTWSAYKSCMVAYVVSSQLSKTGHMASLVCLLTKLVI